MSTTSAICSFRSSSLAEAQSSLLAFQTAAHATSRAAAQAALLATLLAWTFVPAHLSDLTAVQRADQYAELAASHTEARSVLETCSPHDKRRSI
jgi:hypothetical protein